MNPLFDSFGAEQRTNVIFNTIRQLCEIVDIAYIGEPSLYNYSEISGRFYDFGNTEKSISRWANIERLFLINMFPKSICLFNALDKQLDLGAYDYIFCRYLPYASLCGLRRYANKLILDIDDIPEQALQIDFTQKEGLRKIYFNLLRKAYRRDTNHWIRRCKQCYVPNRIQAEEYGIGYLPNISSIWADGIEKFNPNLLFIGKLDWKPNFDGIMHFLENCWPLIHAQFPSTILYVGGKGLDNGQAKKFEERFTGVKFLGFVKDIKEFYKLGSVVICPIYSGAGTNIKIVEALSMAKTLVTSRESTKGYEQFLKNNINCIIADNDQDYIDSITSLLNNPDRANTLALQGFNDVKDIYSQNYIKSVLSKDLGL